MTHATSPLKHRKLDRDRDLHELLEYLLDSACRRQLWTLFIDHRGCLGDPVLPMADYPADPGRLVEVEGHGALTNASLLAAAIEQQRSLSGNAAVVLVWERPGDEAMTRADRAWAVALGRGAAQAGVPLRAQFLLHDGGLKRLRPDDLV